MAESSTKTCKYCAMDIPEKAKICPHCRKKLTTGLFTKLMLCFFILMAISMVFGNRSDKPAPALSPAESAQKKEDDHNIERAVAAAKTIKSAMRNPDSFKMESAIAMDNGSACFKYRSQNGMGGMNVERAVLVKKTDDIIMTGVKGFEKAWNKECAGVSGKDVVDYLDLAIR